MNVSRAPIFVLAAPFCYGNQVSAMLGQHPALFGLPSLHLFSQATLGDLLAWFGDHPRLARGLLCTVAEVFIGGQTREAVAAAREWIGARRHWRPEELLGAIDQKLAGRRMVEWSFSTAQPQALTRLAEECPEAHFIHVLRDPSTHRKAVIADRRHRGLDIPVDPDRFWLAPNLAIFEFVQSLPWQRRIQLRIEMLATAPQGTLQQLLEWLELPCERSALDAMLKPEQSRFAGGEFLYTDEADDSPPHPVISQVRFVEEIQQSAGNASTDAAHGQAAGNIGLFAARWNYCFAPNL